MRPPARRPNAHLWTFVERLTFARVRRGLNASNLSTAANLARDHVGAIERGEIRPERVTVETCERLAEALDVDVGWLIGGNGRGPA